MVRALDCALDILAEHGSDQVTLREVARRGGMTIGNLQHYFETRELLLEAMLGYIAWQYDVAYAKLNADGTAPPRDRFLGIVRYLLDDIRTPRTNGIFFELWALAHRSPFAAEMLDRTYKHHIDNLEALLLDMNAGMSIDRARTKAVLIAATIEGLMVFMAARREHYFDRAEVDRLCLEQILTMATTD